MTLRPVPKPTPQLKEPRPLVKRVRPIADRVRRDTLAIWGTTCQWCEQPGGALDLHHVKRRSQGGKDLPENLRPVHRKCHMYVHEHPLEAKERGMLA